MTASARNSPATTATAPDAAHQLIAREDTARMPSEKPEQIELLRRQPQGVAGAPDVTSPGVDLDVAEAEALVGRLTRTRPAQHGPDTRGQFSRRERLGD